MPGIHLWHEILKDEIIIPPDDSRGIVLIEPQCKKSKIRIGEMPADSFAIKLDACFKAYDVFKSRYHEAKRADYAIIAIKPERINVIVAEVKTSKGKGISYQMKGGRCLVCYVIDVIKTFTERRDLSRKIDFKYVSFCNTDSSISKRPTVLLRGETSSIPQNFATLSFKGRYSFPRIWSAI